MQVQRFWSVPHVERHRSELALLIALAALLELAFGARMNVITLLVGFATGMVFTRRTAPLAGAGILALALPVSLWYSGAPLAAAVAGVFAYRILVLWLPLPVALASLPTLRTMGERRIAQAEQREAA